MASYRVKLLDKKEVAVGTMAFSFEKPPGFVYQAGQHCDWTEIDPPETDAQGNTHTFTLASAPYENFLMIATRTRDTAFKRVLKNMSIGTQLEMDGPRGMLTLPKDAAKPAVFLAGGIGITPFRSMVLEATHDHDPRRLYLFYSNRHPDDAPFMEEFYQAQMNNSNFKFIPTITKPQEVSHWQGEKGYINQEVLQRYIDDLAVPIYYLAGPSEMVNALNELVVNMGISPDNIKVEDFPGY